MTEVARLSVVVDANIAAAAAKLKGVDAQFHRVAGSARAMDKQVAATTTSTRRASTSYHMLGDAATQATQAQQKAAPAIAKTDKATRSFGRASQSARGAMQGMGAGFTPIQAGAIAAGYALGKTIQVTSNFDGAMRNVNSIAGLSETQFKSLSNEVNAMARNTAQAPQTLAEGMYDLVSTGYDTDEALKLIKTSATAATAGLTDTATSTSTMTGVLRAYNLKASEAGKVSDDLFKTVELGKINFEQLAQGIGPVLPMAGALGVNLKQVGAAVALMTYQGVPAAESFTYLKGAMTQMVKPSEDLEKAYDRLGVTSGEELVKKTGNLQNALQALYKDSGGDKEKFAKMFPDVRGLTAALQLTGSHAKEAGQFLRGFNNDAGITNKVFAEQMKSTPNKWKQVSADVQATARSYGKELTPALNATATGVSTLAKAWDSDIGHKISRWAPTPLAIPNLAKQAAAGVRAAQNVGKGATLGQVKTANISFKVKGDSDALAKSKKVRSGLMSIPSIRNISIKVNSPNDTVLTRTKTALTKLARPVTITTKYKRSGDADTVVKPKAVKITANNDDVKQKADQAKGFVESVNGLRAKPKITTSSNAKEQASAALSALASVDGQRATSYITIKTSKVGSKSLGGTNTTSLTEVNERGPESITSPSGHTAMLGDGSRQIMALPIGWHVNTAGDTRNMQHLAGGGKVKRRAEAKGQRGLDKIDFLDATGRLSDKAEASRLKAIAGIKHLPTATKRDAQRRLYELQNGRKSTIRDSKDQAKMIGLDPAGAAKVTQDMAKRHLQEAKRAKDAQAIAQAEQDLKQATNDLAAAQRQMSVDNLDAGVALAKLTPDTADDMAAYGKQRDYWAQKLYELQHDAIADDQQGAAIAEAANGITAATEAISGVADAIKATIDDLTKEVKRQNDLADRSLPIQREQAKKWVADVIAEMGGSRYGQRKQTATRRQGAYAVR